MTEKEIYINKYMKNLGLTREEAEEMWLDEQADNLPELTAEQKAVEKEMRQADRAKETAPRKRERKPDAAKRQLIDWLADTIGEAAIITNPEREIEFMFNGNHYRLTLSKPRKEKK